jgi:hypothetical protein
VDAGERAGFGDVYPADVGVGDPGPQDGAVEHAGEGQVVGVAGGAGHFGDGVGAGEGTAHRAPRRAGGGDERFTAPPGGRADSLHDAPVAGTAAEVVAQCGENLLIGGGGVAQEEPQRGHNHPRRAEATLERAVADEGLLQGMQLSLPRQSLNGEDLGALGFQGREAAGADGLAVQQNGARAAGPFPAADFGAGEAPGRSGGRRRGYGLRAHPGSPPGR